MSDIAFGFVDLREFFKNRIVDVPGLQRRVSEAIDRTAARHNEEADRFMSAFSVPVTVAKERYIMPGGGTMQSIREDDNPLPTVTYKGNDVGYPIRGGADAMANNRVSRQMITVKDANDMMQETRIKDKNWLIDHILAATFTNTPYNYEDLPYRGLTGLGEVTVKPLANGDGDVYLTDRGRNVKPDNHYFAQTEAISAAFNPLPRFRRSMTEHGPNPDAKVITYVAPDLVASIENLPGFVERNDADIAYGANRDTLRGTPDRGIGDEVIGRVNRCWIIEAERLPDGYMVGHLDGTPFLGQREYPARALRGLFKEENNVDGNHQEVRHLRFTGFGCRNRVGAAVMQIGAATYNAPDAYTAPLP